MSKPLTPRQRALLRAIPKAGDASWQEVAGRAGVRVVWPSVRRTLMSLERRGLLFFSSSGLRVVLSDAGAKARAEVGHE